MRKHLLIGISTAALAAGTAAAQTTTDSNGNTSIRQCSPGNTCTVDNMEAGNDRNRAFIRQTGGEDNFAIIRQRGDDNSSTIEQRGNDNTAFHGQNGDDNISDTDQTGDDNFSSIDQGNEDNSATVTQTGDGNFSDIDQGVGDDDEFGSYVITGENNVATVTQTGSNLSSDVFQGRYGGGGSGSADDNRVVVIQTGSGSDSYVGQFTRGNSATVRMAEGGLDISSTNNSMNMSYVGQFNNYFTQDSDGEFVDDEGGPDEFNNPDSDNVANISIRGRQNRSTIQQNGVENEAVVTMSGGGSGVSQPGVASPSSTSATPRNLPAGRIQGNSATILQTGASNFAEVVAGSERNLSGNNAALEGQGNTSSIRQGARFPGNSQGLGTNHRATTYQRGILDSVEINQDNNSGTVTNTTGTTATPETMNGDQDGSIADVAQLSINSTTTVNQRGTNTAIVTQGANRTESGGGDNSILVDQTDAGNTSTSGGGGIFTPGTSDTTTQRNFAEVTQYGIGNSATVAQNAVNGRAVVFQTLGSRANTVNIQQGTGQGLADGVVTPSQQGNNLTLTANVTQSGRGSSVTVGQSGQFLSATVNQTGTITGNPGSNNSINLSQVSDNSIAIVTQNGFDLSATIDQRGNGTAANPNRVTVTQTGDSHQATAIQEPNSGASGANSPAGSSPGTNTGGNPGAFPRARSAGANSAEIEIMQSGNFSTASGGGAGNSATVTQQGAGQLAVINQNGRSNVAGILQGSFATNSVAIIEQNGNSNTFFITQGEAGQYFRVSQTGGGNISTTSASGPGGGGTTASGTGASQPLLPPVAL